MPSAGRRLDNLTACALPRRVDSGWLVQPVVLVVVRIVAGQSMTHPDVDSLSADPEHCRGLHGSQHACFVQSIKTWTEVVTSSDTGNDRRSKWFPFAGVHRALVQDGCDLLMSMLTQQSIDHVATGFPFLPGSERKWQVRVLVAPPLKWICYGDLFAAEQGKVFQ